MMCVSTVFSHRRSSKGFTLLEVLIALLILAVVVSTLYSVHSGTVYHLTASRSQAEIYEMARVTLARMTEDLACAHRPPDEPLTTGKEPENDFFSGEEIVLNGTTGHTLQFVTRASLGFAAGGDLLRIRLDTRQEEGLPGLTLYRTETAVLGDPPPPEKDGWVLCEDVWELTVSYQDADGRTYARWDSSAELFGGRLPVLVSITLRLHNPANRGTPYRFTTQVALPLGRDQDRDIRG